MKIVKCFLTVFFFFIQDLYSEAYSFVCVMFASIPNFKEFYQQNSVNKNGLECIRVLNEIIADFDLVRMFWASLQKCDLRILFFKYLYTDYCMYIHCLNLQEPWMEYPSTIHRV